MFRNSPTPTTAPVPSTNVPPKYACMDRNEPSPTCISPTSGSPMPNIQASSRDTSRASGGSFTEGLRSAASAEPSIMPIPPR